MVTDDQLLSNAFRAMDHLIQGLPVLSFEKVRTGWANCKVNKADPPIEDLLSSLERASRGERALIETALTIYNGGEYLVHDEYGGPHPQGRNVLRHVMDWTDSATFRRIMEALMIARDVRHVRNPKPLLHDGA